MSPKKATAPVAPAQLASQAADAPLTIDAAGTQAALDLFTHRDKLRENHNALHAEVLNGAIDLYRDFEAHGHRPGKITLGNGTVVERK
jgi:hypothetical protein